MGPPLTLHLKPPNSQGKTTVICCVTSRLFLSIHIYIHTWVVFTKMQSIFYPEICFYFIVSWTVFSIHRYKSTTLLLMGVVIYAHISIHPGLFATHICACP